MAGFMKAIDVYFDSNIEKVMYGDSVSPVTQEITSSGGCATLPSTSACYFKPIFKDGYEIDTYTNVETTDVDGVYSYSGSDDMSITFTSKLSGAL